MFHTSGIAILIATYNGEAYLCEQLDSLLSQTKQEWKAYIHDDGSTDGTAEILRRYTEQYPGHFVCVEGSPAGSARDNFFSLFRNVDAPWYMCCDQDDFWLSDKVERTRAAMAEAERDSEVPCLVHTDLKIADSSLRVLADSMDRYQKLDCHYTDINHILIQNRVTGCAMMINKCLRDRMLQVKDADDIIMHDWWAAMVAAQFGVLRYVDEPTVLYRQHGENDIGAQKAGAATYLGKLFHGRAEIRDSLEAVRRQAELFAETFSLPPDSVVSVYSRINNYPRRKRMDIYRRYQIQKSPAGRQFGIWLFG